MNDYDNSQSAQVYYPPQGTLSKLIDFITFKRIRFTLAADLRRLRSHD